MKVLCLVLLLVLPALAQEGDRYLVVYDSTLHGVENDVPQVPGASYVDVSVRDDYRNPFWKQANDDLRKIFGPANPVPVLRYPHGSIVSLLDGVSGTSLTHIAQQRLDAQPRRFTTPVEAPMVILQSYSNAYGIALAATDGGELVTAIAHQSPYVPEVARSNLLAALERRRAALDRLTDVHTNQAAAIAFALANVPTSRVAGVAAARNGVAGAGSSFPALRSNVTNALDKLWQEILLLRAEVEALQETRQ